MPIVVAFIYLLSTFTAPAAGLTVQVNNGSVTIWLLNSDPRYEDFIVHIAGHADIPVHAPVGKTQDLTIPACGMIDIVGETVSNPPVLFDRFQATAPCRVFLPLLHGAAVDTP